MVSASLFFHVATMPTWPRYNHLPPLINKSNCIKKPGLNIKKIFKLRPSKDFRLLAMML